MDQAQSWGLKWQTKYVFHPQIPCIADLIFKCWMFSKLQLIFNSDWRRMELWDLRHPIKGQEQIWFMVVILYSRFLLDKEINFLNLLLEDMIYLNMVNLEDNYSGTI